MADLTEQRQIVQVEEVQTRSALSEQLFQKIGANQNFHALRQYDKHSFKLNGSYPQAVGSTGIDGVFPFLFDVELTGFYYYNDTTGSSGSTSVDVHWLSGGVDNGTIFFTPPIVASTASNNSITIYRQTDATTLSNPTGHTLAVLSKTTFDAGDTLRLDLDSVMPDANTFEFGIFFRPR